MEGIAIVNAHLMDTDNNPQSPNVQPQTALMNELRQARIDAQRLNSNVLEHLKSFQQVDDSFKTLPSYKDKPPDPDLSVGSTCTAIMALLSTGKHNELFSKRPAVVEKTKVDFADLFKRVVSSKWESSGLPDGNPFTTALVVRTAGFIVRSKTVLSAKEVGELKHTRFRSKNEKGLEIVDETVADKTLQEIIKSKAASGGDSFAVSKYPAKTTIVYWFLDGAINAGVDLSSSLPAIASWATQQFHRQLIYVSAGNDALMDPPELAMAACLINRIHGICSDRSELADISRSLPSQVELTFAVERVLTEQPRSGIWHKYFPLFHFPHGEGAADYCFTFEFLEAVLSEFGSAVLRTRELLAHFKQSLSWCDGHALHFVNESGTHFRGWNSGGEVKSLAAGMPESWATAAVHMFLSQLHHKIDELLDWLVLKNFGFDRMATVKSQDEFNRLIDVNIEFPSEPPTTLLTVLRSELIANAEQSANSDNWKLDVPRSALFFGPPGTSKTNLAKSIAAYLGWPMIIVTPSHFLGRGLEQVHSQVDEVFRDLMDLRQAVVFFDEMDALAQTREEDPEEKGGEPLDVTRQLLTTSMLPKLADLWERGGVVFLMATNHKQQLDPAITRANRFDLLLCIAPPPWSGKRQSAKLEKILKIADSKNVEAQLVRLVAEKSKTKKLLDLFTVSELGVFFDHLRRVKNTRSLVDALKKYAKPSEFAATVDAWSRKGIVLRKGTFTREEYDKDTKESRRQYYRKEQLLTGTHSMAAPPRHEQANKRSATRSSQRKKR